MNELVLPPSPNWYNGSILVCTPENHVVYASRKDIVILNSAPVSEAAEVNVLHGAHDDRVLSVNANLVTWGKPNKQLISVGEDKIVKLWNFDSLTCEMQHNDHEKNVSAIVTASFAGERVISVSENGLIIVWQLAANTRRSLTNIFGMKVKVMCMATCPHAVYLTAFGLASGLVVVADLRQSGKVLYKMREHDHDITGLSWCPVPYNIYKTKSGIQMMNSVKWKTKNFSAFSSAKDKTTKYLKDKEQNDNICEDMSEGENIDHSSDVKTDSNEATSMSDNAFVEMCKELQDKLEITSTMQETTESLTKTEPVIDITPKKTADTDDIDDSFAEIIYPIRERPVVDKKNPWGNIEFNDSDEEDQEVIQPETTTKVEDDDFLKACLQLRNKIITKTTEPESEKLDDELNNKETFMEKDNDVKTETEEKCVDTIPENIDDNHPIEQTNCLLTSNVKLIEATEYVFDLSLNDPDEQKEYLLASACRAGTICIWRAGSDGHLQIQLPKHLKSSYSNKKRDNRQNWISLTWLQPTLILSSSIWHELLTWDLLPKPTKAMKFQIKSSLIHADHKKYIFTIAAAYRLFEKPENEDWRTNKELCVWTTSHDRWLLCTNLSTRCNVASYSTFGGNITCMSVSQLDPNRLAYAVGDGTIRIWDLSRPHKQHITNTSFFDKVHTKATCIDWHPTRENFLAFSTCEGRIGEYDMTNRSRSATIYSNYHRGMVYKLQWGPLPGDEEKYGLYSCSLGELIVHDASKPSKEPYQLAIFEDENVTNFAWKTDYTVLAVGSKNGSVKLLNPKFKLLQTLYMQKKSIRSLEWHPLATACDTGISEYSNYLAVSTKESEIFIYDCLNQHGDADTKIQHFVLKGHSSSVKCMAWCPQVSGRLVSAEDGITIVWDIKTQTMLSVFVTGTDNSVLWSPLDADLIISGGKIMQIWRITKNPPVLPDIPKKKESKQKKFIKIASSKNEQNGDVVFTHKEEKDRKKSMLTLTTRILFNTETMVKSCRKLLQNVDVEETVDDSSDSEEFEDAKEHSETNVDSLIDPLKLFGNRKDILTVLDQEQMYHLQKKKITNHGLISLWKGNLNETIKHAIESNEITPWIINMAPMVSHKTWLELSEKYAQILCNNEEYLEASSYFLICHKVDEAIDALCKGHHFKEALTLAKVRLPEGNEKITIIMENWMKYATTNGLYEVAAMLYIKANKFLEAAEILNKRSDLETLKLAAELAEKTTNKDLLNAINTKINEFDKSDDVPTDQNGINICESRLQALLLNEKKKQLVDLTVEELTKDIDDNSVHGNEPIVND